MDLPIEHGDFPELFVNVYQRVPPAMAGPPGGLGLDVTFDPSSNSSASYQESSPKWYMLAENYGKSMKVSTFNGKTMEHHNF